MVAIYQILPKTKSTTFSIAHLHDRLKKLEAFSGIKNNLTIYEGIKVA